MADEWSQYARKSDAAPSAAPPADEWSKFARPAAQRTWLDSAGDFAHTVWEGAGGQTIMDLIGGASRDPKLGQKSVETAKGLVQGLINEPSRIWEESKKSGNAMLSGDAPEAMKHLAGMVPVFGAGAVQAGDEVGKGEYAKGFGHALGMLAPFLSEAAVSKVRPPAATPAAVPGAKPSLPERLYQGAINPRITTNPADVRAMVSTGLENGITVSEAGAAKLNGLLADLNQQIQAKIQPHAAAGGTIDPNAVVTRLADVESRLRDQALPEKDLKEVESAGQEWLRTHGAGPGKPPIPPRPSGVGMTAGTPAVPPRRAQPIPSDQAHAIKVGTYRKLAGKFGEVATDAQVEAQKALARGIKEELQAQLPELAGLNASEGKLLDLRGPLEDAVAKATNRLGKGLTLSEAGTVGAAHVVTGSGTAALGAGIMKHVLGDPAVRSRLAIMIYKAQKANPGKFGVSTMAGASARAAEVAAALGSIEDGGQ